ncbi:hypothetical protein Runsl_4721 [Runella slithyformis DSM 19594]|uniref:Uncharacterized protein n=1 Tax=Runella slithyformis (strain ATCC 29530 / DSM 19594 / LMG 11500 / NCIMB 11436 / LSU 4) TaxID=761193 RepID=A0A7U4E838_RUNSL|nr:hypothetical protein Runsl_4721 [Runella slithyformis DSM 19594]
MKKGGCSPSFFVTGLSVLSNRRRNKPCHRLLTTEGGINNRKTLK